MPSRPKYGTPVASIPVRLPISTLSYLEKMAIERCGGDISKAIFMIVQKDMKTSGDIFHDISEEVVKLVEEINLREHYHQDNSELIQKYRSGLELFIKWGNWAAERSKKLDEWSKNKKIPLEGTKEGDINAKATEVR